jgi:hypothetical protein
VKDTLRYLVLAALLAAPPGCSFSYSSKSISDSISGSSTSISDSSESSSPASDAKTAARDALYREDVRDFTAAHVRGAGDVASFQRGLAEVALRHGVTDWEAVPATWSGVGEGLRRAAASASEVDALSAALAGDDPDRRREIERAYDGAA